MLSCIDFQKPYGASPCSLHASWLSSAGGHGARRRCLSALTMFSLPKEIAGAGLRLWQQVSEGRGGSTRTLFTLYFSIQPCERLPVTNLISCLVPRTSGSFLGVRSQHSGSARIATQNNDKEEVTCFFGWLVAFLLE